MNANGYVLITTRGHPRADKDGYILEHILVMEAHLGRYLIDDEIVHHKNQNRSDNRIENLQLMTNSEHMKHHRKLMPPSKKVTEFRLGICSCGCLSEIPIRNTGGMLQKFIVGHNSRLQGIGP